jgi:hypothetical protein
MSAVIIAAFASYWTEVKSGRLRFWQKPPIALGAELVNFPVVYFLLAIARARYGGAPSAAGFATLIAGATIAIGFVAGAACLLIPAAREPFTDNIRKFLAVTWIALSAAAVFVSIDYFIPWISHFQDWFGYLTDDPDLLGVAVPASIVAIAIIACEERAFGEAPSATQSLAGALFLGLGVFFGLLAFLGLPV